MLNIVIVEDNLLLQEELIEAMRGQGYCAHGADSAEQLNEILAVHPMDVLVLDVNLPYEDGFSIASRMRQRFPDLFIIMLTARTRPSDRTQGYAAGIDIYLSKPTNPAELFAILRNMQRRREPESGRSELKLNILKHSLFSQNGSFCHLTEKETTFLEALALAPEGLAETDFLLEHFLHRRGLDITREYLAVIASRIRTKAAELSGNEEIIRAVRNRGYKLIAGLELVT